MIKQQQPRKTINNIEEEYSFDKVLLPTLIKANANSQYSVNLRKEYDSMTGSPEEKCKVLSKRLEKFFGRDKNAKINIRVGYFCLRRDPNYHLLNVLTLDNQIILFGTDFIKKKQIMEQYNPEDCSLIDLSHWKLIYDDYLSALNALNKNQRQNVIENKLKLEKGQIQIPKKWIEMKPYYTGSFERRVLARFATSDEKETSGLARADSWIFQSAKKVYESKKKQTELIIENCRLRDQIIKERIMQKREHLIHYHQNKRNFNNLGKQEKKLGSFKDKKQQYKQRQRSRDKSDLDQRMSIRSKSSSLSDLVNGVNKIGLNDFDEEDEFNVSFILNEDHQLSRQIQDKFYQGGVIFDINDDSLQININNDISVENKSVISQNMMNKSYSLSSNMPGISLQKQISFNVKEFNYTNYIKEQQIEEQRRRQQDRQVINLIDSEED